MNLNDYTNEALYAGLTDGTLPEEALTALRDRLYPIIMNEAKPYFQKLSWNRDDALQEALILIWQTVARKSFNPNIARGQYHDFFSKAWRNRMRLETSLQFQPLPQGHPPAGRPWHHADGVHLDRRTGVRRGVRLRPEARGVPRPPPRGVQAEHRTTAAQLPARSAPPKASPRRSR